MIRCGLGGPGGLVDWAVNVVNIVLVVQVGPNNLVGPGGPTSSGMGCILVKMMRNT